MEFAATFLGRQRYEPRLWPAGFAPTLYDLDAAPYGAFPNSKPITADGALRIVPLPGHSIGQIGVIARTDNVRLLFCADHIRRQDWFLEDYGARRLLGLGIFHLKLAVETSRRIHQFVSAAPTVLIPSHDEEAPDRLAAVEPVSIDPRASEARRSSANAYTSRPRGHAREHA